MKRIAVIAGIFGLALFSLVLALSGVDEILDAIRAAGWATALVVAARAVALVWAGFAWHLLFPPGSALPISVSVLLRFIREGINQLLPVGQVGGDLVGARLATFWRMEGALAGAVTIADVALQAATQFIFAVIGLALLVWLNGDSAFVRYALVGLVVAALGIGAFFVVQGHAGARLLGALVARLAGPKAARFGDLVERLWARLGVIYASPGRVIACGSLHLAGWVFGALEVWVALHFMGYPISFAEAVVIESLGQAVRGAAFAVPGGLGVQEGGYVALCALFGVPPGPAVALSLVKRVADLALGLPFLVAWQWLEGRRAIRAAPLMASEAASR